MISAVAGQEQKSATQARDQKWVADRDHSSIQFRTSHWGIVDIVGWFEEFEVVVRTRDDDFSKAQVEARVTPSSVRMPNLEMAANLRRGFASPDAPQAVFRSVRVEEAGEDRYLLHGELTIGTITKPITWQIQLNGYGSPRGGSAGFTGRTELMRLEFEIGDTEVFPGNQQPVVGLSVEITCNIRLDRVYE